MIVKMNLELVLSNIEAIRNELRDLPEVFDSSFEQRLLYLDSQLSVCGDYLADFVFSARKEKEVKERSHEIHKDKRMLELMEDNPSMWKSVSKAEAKAKSEDEYTNVIEERAQAIAHERLIVEKIASVSRMSNSIARKLNSLNTEKIKFNG
jgi:hypothetical protein